MIFENFKLSKLNRELEIEINELISNNLGAVFHEPLLNKIAAKYFDTDLYYLIEKEKNQIINASPIHVTKKSLGRKIFEFKPPADIPYAGFIIPVNDISTKLSTGLLDSIKYYGFPNKDFSSYGRVGVTSMVDLEFDEDEIFLNVIHSKRRNMIRKAAKSGISVKAFQNSIGFDLLWPLLNNLHIKLGYKNLKEDYYRDVFNSYCNKDKAAVLIASKDSEVISGVFILGNNNYMHYYKGASKEGIKNEGQGELLQWEAIKWSKIRAKHYDLCNLNKEKLPAIYRFKTGISNHLYHYEIIQRQSNTNKILNRILSK